MHAQGDNVDVIKVEHIDRQKRSMDDHKRPCPDMRASARVSAFVRV